MKKLFSLSMAALFLGGCAHGGLYSPSFDHQEGHIFQYQAKPLDQGNDLELTVWASPFHLSHSHLERELRRFASQEALKRACETHHLDAVTFGQYNTLINGRRYARGVMRCAQIVTPLIARDPSVPFTAAPEVPPLEAPVSAAPDTTEKIPETKHDAGDKLNAAIAAGAAKAANKKSKKPKTKPKKKNKR